MRDATIEERQVIQDNIDKISEPTSVNFYSGEKIKFPFQYLEKYLIGEMDFDVAIDSTLEEANRLIEEYLEKHKNLL